MDHITIKVIKLRFLILLPIESFLIKMVTKIIDFNYCLLIIVVITIKHFDSKLIMKKQIHTYLVKSFIKYLQVMVLIKELITYFIIIIKV